MKPSGDHDQGEDADSSALAEAEAWFVRLRSSHPRSSLIAEFSRWMVADERNARAYRQTQSMWDQAERVRDEPSIKALLRDYLAVAPPKPEHVPRWAALALAAALVAALAMPWERIAGWQARGPSERAVHVDAGRFVTARLERREVVLPDGSRVLLDGGTVLSTRISARERAVTLERGQAYFVVAKDASRPFFVQIDQAKIMALGTAFDIKRGDGKDLVTLFHGRVRVENRSAGGVSVATLEPGQRVSLTSSTRLTPYDVDLEQARAWHEGKLVFEGATLSEVVAELNRQGSVPIRLTGSDRGYSGLRGTFDTGDSESVLRSLDLLYPIAVNRRPHEIVITIEPIRRQTNGNAGH
jgi:transmembrane sensor